MNQNGIARLYYPKNTPRGSAVLIGPRLVLTCEHVVRGIRQGATVWLDREHKSTVLQTDRNADLAILQLAEPLSHAPTPWRLAGHRGGTVTAVGFPGIWKKAAPKEVETRVTSACPQFTELTIEEHLEPGHSGGGLFLVKGTTAYLIGLLQCNRNELNSSKAIGAAAVRSFLSAHGFPFPDQDPAPAPPSRKYDDSKYLNWLRGYTRKIDFRGLKAGKKEVQEYPMDQLYIPLMTNRDHATIRLEEAISHYSRLVIQGDAGSGKSTFLRQFAWQCCRPDRTVTTTPFPLLVSIAALDAFIQWRGQQLGYSADDPRWLPAFLADQAAGKKWDLDFDFFDAKLTESNTLVLLDGLDEASNVDSRESIVRLFEEAHTAYHRCRWVVTTRPRAYEGKATLLDFDTCSILELEPAQIESFIGQWSLCLKDGDAAAAEDHRTDLRNALRKSPPKIARMARNPLMLSALAVVHYNERQLPDQRAELYECILQWLAKSRKEKPGRLRPETILKCFGYIAYRMQNYNGKYVIRIPQSTAAEWLTAAFSLDDAMEFLEEEDLDSGITASEGKQLKFYHRSYQEFLAARYLAEETSAKRWKLAEPCLLRPEWRESFVLLAGVLYTKGEAILEEFLEQLLTFGEAQFELSNQARVVGLLGSMLNDLAAVKYTLSPPASQRYTGLQNKVLCIFEPHGAAVIDVLTRADVADALGQAGDPRLCYPRDPRYWVSIGDFQFGRFPVTVQEYAVYVDAGGPEPPKWDDQLEYPNRPIVYVSRKDAEAYCRWVSGVRLPTEQEWEAAAYGRERRQFPWGNEPEPDSELANFNGNVGRTTPVGLFPKGNTPEGVADMAGNVWEWTASGTENGGIVVRGGAYHYNGSSLRGAYRFRLNPGLRNLSLGFRLVRG